MSIVTVSTEAILRGPYRKQTAWERICDFASYQNSVKEISEIIIHERNETEGRSEWFVMLDGAPFSWFQIENYNREKFTVEFDLIHGDFEHYKGCWVIRDGELDGIEIQAQIEYGLGIPVLEDAVKDVLQDKVQTFTDNMMASLKAYLDLHASEERKSSRFDTIKPVSLRVKGRAIAGTVFNYSNGGLLLGLEEQSEIEQGAEARLTIGDMILSGRVTIDNKESGLVRLVLNEPLSDVSFDRLHGFLNAGMSMNELLGVYEVVKTHKHELTLPESVY